MANECPQLFRGLIIENTFTSFSDMLNDLFYAPFWVRKFITIQWNTYKYVSDLKMPILYTTGDSDEIIPYDYTLNLYKLSKQAYFKELFVIYGGHHYDSWKVAGEIYFKKLEMYIKRCIQTYQGPPMIPDGPISKDERKLI